MTGDCADTTEEMTVDSRDSKDLQLAELTDEQHTKSTEPNDQQTMQQQQHTSKFENTTNAAHETDSEATESLVRQTTNSPTSTASRSPETHMDINCNKSPYGELTTSPKHRSPGSPLTQESSHTSANDGKIDLDNSLSPFAKSERAPSSSPTPQQNCILNDTAVPTSVSSSASNMIPKLRLNALLASDPALKPDAKDLKAIHDEAQLKKQSKSNSQLPAPPALLKQENFDAMLTATQAHNLAESVLLKSAGNLTPSPADIPPRIKVFMCLPCGIGFSSPSTLEAHQAYYCSHRNKDSDENNATLPTTATEKRSSPTGTSNSGNSTNASTANSANVEPSPKAIKTGKQYACTQCSYSADKKVSLNRHMRMHQTSPASSSSASANGIGMLGGTNSGMIIEDNSSQQVDRYCSECDIRFSNVKTYRAHKQHYCSSRRTEGQLTPKLEVNASAPVVTKPPNIVSGAMSPQTRTKTPTQAMVVAAAAAAAAAAASLQPTTQPFVALPTNPILIIPYSLIRVGNLIPGPPTTAATGVTNPDTTCFMFDNGIWKPIATALNMSNIGANATSNTATSSPVPNNNNNPSNSNNSEPIPSEKSASQRSPAAETVTKRKEPGIRESAPLDLSLRRSPIATLQQHLRSTSGFLDMDTLLEAGKENLSLDDTGSITPEQIVCAPSLPNSPSMSPSPKRRAVSPRSSGAGSSSSMSPPASVVTSASLAAAASNILDNLPLRPILPADIALKLSESNIISPLLTKQNLELALKLSAAAAAVNSTGGVPSGATPAEIAAAAVAAASKSTLLGLPVMPSAASAAAAAASAQPQIYVKQGVSKCKECNIVFCKYENYLAHKQHYCSARNQETTESETKTSSTPPINSSTPDTTPVAYQQLICAACGIKYTSLDNLRAHQNYYCPKGGGVGSGAAAASAALAAATASVSSEGVQHAMPKEKCSKCKTVHELCLPCPPPPALQQPAPQTNASSSSGNVYKCPLCDVVSLTASESRKHMETHASVKAFRCSICRYKGNTLRGMRTHIRMHFDKKTSDFNEEHYMSCILEDDGIEIPSASSLSQEQLTQQIITAQHKASLVAAAAASLQSQQPLQQQQPQHLQQQQPVFNCDICNYSSSYKGNVLRHMKLVHPQMSISSPSISPESAFANPELDSTMDGNSRSESLNGDNNASSFTIKSEPFDALSAPAQSNAHDNNASPPVPPTTAINSPHATVPHIKSEPLDIVNDLSNTAIHLPPPHTSPISVGQTAAHPPPPPPPLGVTPEEQMNLSQKYCQTCDISFNYMKTYLAHKQFYCKSKIRRPDLHDERASPTAVGSILPPVSPNSIHLQKNKENLQQEAAI